MPKGRKYNLSDEVVRFLTFEKASTAFLKLTGDYFQKKMIRVTKDLPPLFFSYKIRYDHEPSSIISMDTMHS